MRYKITYSLTGYSDNEDIIEAKNYTDAEYVAYLNACQIYDNFAGMYGIKTVKEIMKEEELSYKDAHTIYIEERDSEINYSVKLIQKLS